MRSNVCAMLLQLLLQVRWRWVFGGWKAVRTDSPLCRWRGCGALPECRQRVGRVHRMRWDAGNAHRIGGRIWG